MPDNAQTYELSFLSTCRKVDISRDGPDFCSLAMPETAQKYELPFLRACRKVDISWDGLQFSRISLCRRLLKISSYPFSEHAARLIVAETVFNFYAFLYAGDCSKVWVILSQSMQEGWYWLRRSSISMHELMPETAQKYKLSFLRACRKVDICWDALQFQCISLCQRLLKSMSYPSSEHAERLILAEMLFNFYVLAYAGDSSKVCIILSRTIQKGWY